MSRIVAIGKRERIEGLALAGVEILPAEGAEAVRGRWNELEGNVAVVILTRDAESAVSDLLTSRGDLVWTRLPD
jgi:vacuolar-type H+-ATPase subunit F/Vma7